MKKIINTVILFVSGATLLSAQSIEKKVIGSAGKTLTAGNIQLDFTVGEPFTKSLTTASNSITQGFHQPILTLARLSDPNDTSSTLPAERLNDKLIHGIDITIYPNPAIDFINIKLNHAIDESLTITITNVQGQLVKQEIMQQQTMQIDFSGLVAGTYLIVVKNKKGDLNNTYKVIKTN